MRFNLNLISFQYFSIILIFDCVRVYPIEQNKLATRAHADARENQKAMEKLHIFENKLFLAEQNREKELQKKLDTIRMHVGFLPLLFPYYEFEFTFGPFFNIVFFERIVKKMNDFSFAGSPCRRSSSEGTQQ